MILLNEKQFYELEKKIWNFYNFGAIICKKLIKLMSKVWFF